MLLDASKFGDRHTAENIGVYVEGIMTEYGCDSKIKMYVTDAASNNKKWGNDQEKPRMNCDLTYVPFWVSSHGGHAAGSRPEI